MGPLKRMGLEYRRFTGFATTRIGWTRPSIGKEGQTAFIKDGRRVSGQSALFPSLRPRPTGSRRHMGGDLYCSLDNPKSHDYQLGTFQQHHKPRQGSESSPMIVRVITHVASVVLTQLETHPDSSPLCYHSEESPFETLRSALWSTSRSQCM